MSIGPKPDRKGKRKIGSKKRRERRRRRLEKKRGH
jgi:hypothetical protein